MASNLAVGVPSSFTDNRLTEAEQAALEESQSPDEKLRTLHSRLLSWMQGERDRQAENRLQMAIDHDFYDGLQFSDDDIKKIMDRGQDPLVYNEVKIGLDWIIGAEKRERVDWRVLPRTEDDVESANVKTEVMKYISDVNDLPFVRSSAFAEAAICGLSFLEDSLNQDATADVLFAGMDSWRNNLHDSYNRTMNPSVSRYHFRWKVLDLDIAQSLFPGKADALRRCSTNADALNADLDDELYYLGNRLSRDSYTAPYRRSIVSETVSDIFNRRDRVKIYEAWYREPMEKQMVVGGPFHGDIYDPMNQGHKNSVDTGYADVIPKTIQRVYVCYMTDKEILSVHESPFKHNEFPFTPIFCFRRGRDGMPYGFVRNIRDPQEDLNKRMTKALFLQSVNQIITEEAAFGTGKGEFTLQDAIDNASNPQAVFVLKNGTAKFDIRRDYQDMDKQAVLVGLDRQFIQSGSGVTDELLGRKTNAVSGEAIRARQEQGSATTAGLFDNYRLAIQRSGQKQLSNAERFYSAPKVLRLTRKVEGKPQFDWLKINQPEIQPDGSIRFLNDITASKADFIVDEQDFRQSMRQAMFDSLSEMVGKIAQYQPMFAISMLDLVVDVADFPGKEDIVNRLKMLIQEARGGGAKSPQQQQQEQAQAALVMRGAAAKIARDEATAAKDQATAQATAVTTQAKLVESQTGATETQANTSLKLAQANLADAQADSVRAALTPDMVAVDLQTVPQGSAPAAGATGAPGAAAPAGGPDVGAQIAGLQKSVDGLSKALALLLDHHASQLEQGQPPQQPPSTEAVQP